MGLYLEQLWEGTGQLKQDTRHTSLWVGNGVLWQGPAKGCHKAASMNQGTREWDSTTRQSRGCFQ